LDRELNQGTFRGKLDVVAKMVQDQAKKKTTKEDHEKLFIKIKETILNYLKKDSFPDIAVS
jgi:hypothetical protein